MQYTAVTITSCLKLAIWLTYGTWVLSHTDILKVIDGWVQVNTTVWTNIAHIFHIYYERSMGWNRQFALQWIRTIHQVTPKLSSVGTPGRGGPNFQPYDLHNTQTKGSLSQETRELLVNHWSNPPPTVSTKDFTLKTILSWLGNLSHTPLYLL